MVTGYEAGAYRDLSKISRSLERIAIALELIVDKMDAAPPLPPETPED